MDNLSIDTLVKNYSLTIILTSLFLISWMGQAYFQWHEFEQDAQDHNTSPEDSDEKLQQSLNRIEKKVDQAR